MCLWPDAAAPGQHVDQRVERRVPWQIQAGARLNGGVYQGNWGVRAARPPLPGQIASDDAYQRAAVQGGEQGDVAAFDRLVFRRRELVLAGQVHPQLDAVEDATALDEFGGWGLDVQDSRPRGHPLGGPVGDETAATVRILVREKAVDDVGDCFEATVRMPVCTARFAGLVFDLAHLVHVDERVEIRCADAGERPHDREALALVPVGAGGDGANRPV